MKTPQAARPNRGLLRSRERLDKYRIETCLCDGPYAAVYQAFDTVEGIRVALKIPHLHLMDDDFVAEFRREVRLAARLDHAHVLPIKYAGFIGDRFVIVCPLGDESLADRLMRRLSLKTALHLAEQSIEAVAHAHHHRVVHCDIKPENFILFPGNHVRLADFGLARMAMRSHQASGSGTIGHMAPEQAMGHPSFRSDVFSLGLILYRLLAGKLPEWPFDWPPPGFERLRSKAHPDLIRVIRKSLELHPARRQKDAQELLETFKRGQRKSLAQQATRKRRRTPAAKRDWRQVRYHQFERKLGRALETRFACHSCGGPVSQYMRACPWCGKTRSKLREDSPFPASCPKCGRGVKLDWRYCPWCYGPGFKSFESRTYTDRRYGAACANPGCDRKQLMPFMKYCPWCHRAVKKKWKIEGSTDKCASCGWGVVPEFWSFCPWCSKRIANH